MSNDWSGASPRLYLALRSPIELDAAQVPTRLRIPDILRSGMVTRNRSFRLALPHNDSLPEMRSVIEAKESRGGDQDQPAGLVPHGVAARKGWKCKTSEQRSTRHPFHECCKHESSFRSLPIEENPTAPSKSVRGFR